MDSSPTLEYDETLEQNELSDDEAQQPRESQERERANQATSYDNEKLEVALTKQRETLYRCTFTPMLLKSNYPVVEVKMYHRFKNEDILNVRHMKSKLKTRLGYVPVKDFLDLFGTKDYPGNIRNTEKGLLLLYQLVKGLSLHQLADYSGVAYSVIRDIHNSFWVDEATRIEKWCNHCLKYCFSTSKIRLLNAHLRNPSDEKVCTLLFDGHDQRIDYLNLESTKEKKKYFSFKLSKSAYRTQVCIDIDNIIVGISESKACNDKAADIQMFEKFNFEPFLAPTDCVYLDGAYKFGTDEVVEKLNEKLEEDYCNANFINPIRKQRNIDFSIHENRYNKSFSGKRSQIETFFSHFQHTFEMFSHQQGQHKPSPKIYNLKLKVAAVLMNIKQTLENYPLFFKIPIEIQKWEKDRFEYLLPEDEQVQENSILVELEKKKTILTIQQKAIQDIIDEEEVNLDLSDNSDSSEYSTLLSEFESFIASNNHSSESETEPESETELERKRSSKKKKINKPSSSLDELESDSSSNEKPDSDSSSSEDEVITPQKQSQDTKDQKIIFTGTNRS